MFKHKTSNFHVSNASINHKENSPNGLVIVDGSKTGGGMIEAAMEGDSSGG